MAAVCGLCKLEEPALRCEDCFGGLMFCKTCMKDLHACNPLHRLEVCVLILDIHARYPMLIDRFELFSSGTVFFSSPLP